MLWLLFNHGELCVCDFIEVLGITQSKASRHLRILYRSGLVTDRRDGLWVYYALRPLQNGLSHDLLNILRTHLATRVGAAQLRKTLAAWLRRKHGDTRCAGRSVGRPVQTISEVAPLTLPGGRQ
jgi:ArsR family transcriptional regulator